MLAISPQGNLLIPYLSTIPLPCQASNDDAYIDFSPKSYLLVLFWTMSISFIYCITNYENINSLKQYTCVISVTVGQKPSMNCMGHFLRSQRAEIKGVSGLVYNLEVQSGNNLLPSSVRLLVEFISYSCRNSGNLLLKSAIHR